MRSALLPLTLAILPGCDGSTSKDDPVEPEEDTDGDGYTESEGDCVPDDERVHPGAEELCNGIDDNCDGQVDEGLDEEWFPDADGDGFGSDSESTFSCSRPADHVPNAEDCDDSSALTHPGANEYCDGIDNDCDGQSDPTACRPLESADFRFDGLGERHKLGHVVAGLGDLDGDGYGDFALGAPVADLTGIPTGSSWFFDGPLDADTTLEDAQARFDGTHLDEWAGWSLSAAGDVDQDGYGDVIVGAWGEPTAGSEAGAAYVLRGPLEGPLTGADAWARWRGESVGDCAGLAVAAAGDVDASGAAHLLIGAANADDAGYSSGAAYLVAGATSGTVSLSTARLRLRGVAEGDQVGAAVAGVGDIDGDGRADVAVSAPGSSLGASRAGAIFVLTDAIPGSFTAEEAAVAILTGGAEGDHAGAALSGFGDFNGDGYGDFLVGAPDQGDGGVGAGAAYVVAGPVLGTSSLRDAHARIIGRLPADHAGNAIDLAGDFDGDGEQDILVGAYIEDSGGLNAGAAFLVRGPVTGTRYLSDADAGFIGEAESDLAGWSAASAGDVDGDDLDDVLIGAPQQDRGGADAGAAYLLYAADF